MAFISIVADMSDREESLAPEPAGYTRNGDDGHTEFGGHGRVAKRDARVAAFAECDEANASISVAVAMGGLPINLTSMLVSVQNDLFDLAADLSVPLSRQEPAPNRLQRAGELDQQGVTSGPVPPTASACPPRNHECSQGAAQTITAKPAEPLNRLSSHPTSETAPTAPA